jgi:hypothetical protein
MVVRGEEAHCASPSLQQILNKDDVNGLSSSSDICFIGRNGSRRTNVCTTSGSRAEQNIYQQKTLAQPSREAEGRNNWQHKKLSAADQNILCLRVEKFPAEQNFERQSRIAWRSRVWYSWS